MTSTRSPFWSRWSMHILMCASLVALVFSLAACGGASSTTPAASSSSAPLTVWVDADRLVPLKLYEKAFPHVKLNVSIVDRTQFPQKVLLDNRAGSGWPDVMFAEPALLAQVEDASHHYPADLTPYVSQSVVNNFAPGSLTDCQVNGKLYCLRNDLAQAVLWYNQKLMKQFGYTVPTTWAQYQALGLRLAKDHPGYVIGAFGDGNTLVNNFYGSECPVHQLVNANTIKINLSDPSCTKVASLLQPLINAGSYAKEGPFDPAFIKLGEQDKILMLYDAAWFGNDVFKTTYKTPAREIAAAAPPLWDGQTTPITGFHGGAAWAMSSHTTNPKAAAALVTWLATSNDYQGDVAPGYPAYAPAAELWAKRVASDPFFASDPYPVLKQAAGQITTKAGNVRFDDFTPYSETVIAAVNHGQTITSALSAYQTQLTGLAHTSGYTVTQ